MSQHIASSPQLPTSSPTTRKALTAIDAVPLDSPLRTTPLHPTLQSIRVPHDAHSSNINPLTLGPFSDADFKHYGYEKLRNELGTKEELEKARDDAVKALRERMEDREMKTREIEREIDEKEKTREIERRVLLKKMGGGGKDG